MTPAILQPHYPHTQIPIKLQLLPVTSSSQTANGSNPSLVVCESLAIAQHWMMESMKWYPQMRTAILDFPSSINSSPRQPEPKTVFPEPSPLNSKLFSPTITTHSTAYTYNADVIFLTLPSLAAMGNAWHAQHPTYTPLNAMSAFLSQMPCLTNVNWNIVVFDVHSPLAQFSPFCPFTRAQTQHPQPSHFNHIILHSLNAYHRIVIQRTPLTQLRDVSDIAVLMSIIIPQHVQKKNGGFAVNQSTNEIIQPPPSPIPLLVPISTNSVPVQSLDTGNESISHTDSIALSPSRVEPLLGVDVTPKLKKKPGRKPKRSKKGGPKAPLSDSEPAEDKQAPEPIGEDSQLQATQPVASESNRDDLEERLPQFSECDIDELIHIVGSFTLRREWAEVGDQIVNQDPINVEDPNEQQQPNPRAHLPFNQLVLTIKPDEQFNAFQQETLDTITTSFQELSTQNQTSLDVPAFIDSYKSIVQSFLSLHSASSLAFQDDTPTKTIPQFVSSFPTILADIALQSKLHHPLSIHNLVNSPFLALFYFFLFESSSFGSFSSILIDSLPLHLQRALAFFMEDVEFSLPVSLLSVLSLTSREMLTHPSFVTPNVFPKPVSPDLSHTIHTLSTKHLTPPPSPVRLPSPHLKPLVPSLPQATTSLTQPSPPAEEAKKQPEPPQLIIVTRSAKRMSQMADSTNKLDSNMDDDDDSFLKELDDEDFDSVHSSPPSPKKEEATLDSPPAPPSPSPPPPPLPPPVEIPEPKLPNRLHIAFTSPTFISPILGIDLILTASVYIPSFHRPHPDFSFEAKHLDSIQSFTFPRTHSQRDAPTPQLPSPQKEQVSTTKPKTTAILPEILQIPLKPSPNSNFRIQNNILSSPHIGPLSPPRSLGILSPISPLNTLRHFSPTRSGIRSPTSPKTPFGEFVQRQIKKYTPRHQFQQPVVTPLHPNPVPSSVFDELLAVQRIYRSCFPHFQTHPSRTRLVSTLTSSPNLSTLFHRQLTSHEYSMSHTHPLGTITSSSLSIFFTSSASRSLVFTHPSSTHQSLEASFSHHELKHSFQLIPKQTRPITSNSSLALASHSKSSKQPISRPTPVTPAKTPQQIRTVEVEKIPTTKKGKKGRRPTVHPVVSADEDIMILPPSAPSPLQQPPVPITQPIFLSFEQRQPFHLPNSYSGVIRHFGILNPVGHVFGSMSSVPPIPQTQSQPQMTDSYPSLFPIKTIPHLPHSFLEQDEESLAPPPPLSREMSALPSLNDLNLSPHLTTLNTLFHNFTRSNTTDQSFCGVAVLVHTDSLFESLISLVRTFDYPVFTLYPILPRSIHSQKSSTADFNRQTLAALRSCISRARTSTSTTPRQCRHFILLAHVSALFEEQCGEFNRSTFLPIYTLDNLNVGAVIMADQPPTSALVNKDLQFMLYSSLLNNDLKRLIWSNHNQLDITQDHFQIFGPHSQDGELASPSPTPAVLSQPNSSSVQMGQSATPGARKRKQTPAILAFQSSTPFGQKKSGSLFRRRELPIYRPSLIQIIIDGSLESKQFSGEAIVTQEMFSDLHKISHQILQNPVSTIPFTSKSDPFIITRIVFLIDSVLNRLPIDPSQTFMREYVDYALTKLTRKTPLSTPNMSPTFPELGKSSPRFSIAQLQTPIPSLHIPKLTETVILTTIPSTEDVEVASGFKSRLKRTSIRARQLRSRLLQNLEELSITSVLYPTPEQIQTLKMESENHDPPESSSEMLKDEVVDIAHQSPVRSFPDKSLTSTTPSLLKSVQVVRKGLSRHRYPSDQTTILFVKDSADAVGDVSLNLGKTQHGLIHNRVVKTAKASRRSQKILMKESETNTIRAMKSLLTGISQLELGKDSSQVLPPLPPQVEPVHLISHLIQQFENAETQLSKLFMKSIGTSKAKYSMISTLMSNHHFKQSLDSADMRYFEYLSPSPSPTSLIFQTPKAETSNRSTSISRLHSSSPSPFSFTFTKIPLALEQFRALRLVSGGYLADRNGGTSDRSRDSLLSEGRHAQILRGDIPLRRMQTRTGARRDERNRTQHSPSPSPADDSKTPGFSQDSQNEATVESLRQNLFKHSESQQIPNSYHSFISTFINLRRPLQAHFSSALGLMGLTSNSVDEPSSSETSEGIMLEMSLTTIQDRLLTETFSGELSSHYKTISPEIAELNRQEIVRQSSTAIELSLISHFSTQEKIMSAHAPSPESESEQTELPTPLSVETIQNVEQNLAAASISLVPLPSVPAIQFPKPTGSWKQNQPVHRQPLPLKLRFTSEILSHLIPPTIDQDNLSPESKQKVTQAALIVQRRYGRAFRNPWIPPPGCPRIRNGPYYLSMNAPTNVFPFDSKWQLFPLTTHLRISELKKYQISIEKRQTTDNLLKEPIVHEIFAWAKSNMRVLKSITAKTTRQESNVMIRLISSHGIFQYSPHSFTFYPGARYNKPFYSISHSIFLTNANRGPSKDKPRKLIQTPLASYFSQLISSAYSTRLSSLSGSNTFNVYYNNCITAIQGAHQTIVSHQSQLGKDILLYDLLTEGVQVAVDEYNARAKKEFQPGQFTPKRNIGEEKVKLAMKTMKDELTKCREQNKMSEKEDDQTFRNWQFVIYTIFDVLVKFEKSLPPPPQKVPGVDMSTQSDFNRMLSRFERPTMDWIKMCRVNNENEYTLWMESTGDRRKHPVPDIEHFYRSHLQSTIGHDKPMTIENIDSIRAFAVAMVEAMECERRRYMFFSSLSQVECPTKLRRERIQYPNQFLNILLSAQSARKEMKTAPATPYHITTLPRIKRKLNPFPLPVPLTGFSRIQYNADEPATEMYLLSEKSSKKYEILKKATPQKLETHRPALSPQPNATAPLSNSYHFSQSRTLSGGPPSLNPTPSQQSSLSSSPTRHISALPSFPPIISPPVQSPGINQRAIQPLTPQRTIQPVISQQAFQPNLFPIQSQARGSTPPRVGQPVSLHDKTSNSPKRIDPFVARIEMKRSSSPPSNYQAPSILHQTQPQLVKQQYPTQAPVPQRFNRPRSPTQRTREAFYEQLALPMKRQSVRLSTEQSENFLIVLNSFSADLQKIKTQQTLDDISLLAAFFSICELTISRSSSLFESCTNFIQRCANSRNLPPFIQNKMLKLKRLITGPPTNQASTAPFQDLPKSQNTAIIDHRRDIQTPPIRKEFTYHTPSRTRPSLNMVYRLPPPFLYHRLKYIAPSSYTLDFIQFLDHITTESFSDLYYLPYLIPISPRTHWGTSFLFFYGLNRDSVTNQQTNTLSREHALLNPLYETSIKSVLEMHMKFKIDMQNKYDPDRQFDKTYANPFAGVQQLRTINQTLFWSIGLDELLMQTINSIQCIDRLTIQPGVHPLTTKWKAATNAFNRVLSLWSSIVITPTQFEEFFLADQLADKLPLEPVKIPIPTASQTLTRQILNMLVKFPFDSMANVVLAITDDIRKRAEEKLKARQIEHEQLVKQSNKQDEKQFQQLQQQAQILMKKQPAVMKMFLPLPVWISPEQRSYIMLMYRLRQQRGFEMDMAYRVFTYLTAFVILKNEETYFTNELEIRTRRLLNIRKHLESTNQLSIPNVQPQPSLPPNSLSLIKTENTQSGLVNQEQKPDTIIPSQGKITIFNDSQRDLGRLTEDNFFISPLPMTLPFQLSVCSLVLMIRSGPFTIYDSSSDLRRNRLTSIGVASHYFITSFFNKENNMQLKARNEALLTFTRIPFTFHHPKSICFNENRQQRLNQQFRDFVQVTIKKNTRQSKPPQTVTKKGLASKKAVDVDTSSLLTKAELDELEFIPTNPKGQKHISKDVEKNEKVPPENQVDDSTVEMNPPDSSCEEPPENPLLSPLLLSQYRSSFNAHFIRDRFTDVVNTRPPQLSIPTMDKDFGTAGSLLSPPDSTGLILSPPGSPFSPSFTPATPPHPVYQKSSTSIAPPHITHSPDLAPDGTNDFIDSLFSDDSLIPKDSLQSMLQTTTLDFSALRASTNRLTQTTDLHSEINPFQPDFQAPARSVMPPKPSVAFTITSQQPLDRRVYYRPGIPHSLFTDWISLWGKEEPPPANGQ
ncbi:hypothetical protein BLNAU_10365 [Blattamonas nauphoetae]|uniref:Uncharacterized protein n=1 Tax=Blattamonas nauphoetae TaxID=2049346 RepID=A0ABQ9XTA7_9EUKA|nr:hypothetical protein BLNAU_10365 [Blattamonas nauphoetae]